MPDRTKARSDKYQHIFTECSFDDAELLSLFHDFESVNDKRKDYILDDINESLSYELWRLAEIKCTRKQYIILILAAGGFTQMEIAKFLNINQSSITKSINGNCDYTRPKMKIYGGSIKKLKNEIDNDPILTELLRRKREHECQMIL